MVGLESQRWSLARQLVMLQLCVVVTAVTIEAMVAIYRPAGNNPGSWEERQILGLVTLTEVALLVGIAGSLFLADRVRRQTFDMEPAEIALRYQHHDVMLKAIREGLIITSVDGDIMLANDEARRLLELTGECVGKALRDQLPGAVWAAAEIPVTDQLEYAAERVLMISRSEAKIDGIPAGMVTTLRDRTELQKAVHERDEAHRHSVELRKQSHEHANHLQVIIALIERRKYKEAIRLCASYAAVPQALSDLVLTRAADPVLAARLHVCDQRAKQHGVRLQLDGELQAVPGDLSEDLADIAGILVDNAIDAVSDHAVPDHAVPDHAAPDHAAPDATKDPRVELRLARDPEGYLCITVRDNGPGIMAEPVDLVFRPGWTTKRSDGHGFGLAKAHDVVSRLGGMIAVHNDDGAVFAVRIPGSTLPVKATRR